MALHRITFHEQGGYTVTCRVRALVDRPTLLDLAVQKIWGPGHYWAWVPGSATEGRVYQQLYDDRGPEDVPHRVRHGGDYPSAAAGADAGVSPRLEGASLDFFRGR